MVGESACRFAVTVMPLTATLSMTISAPSATVTAKRAATGRFAVVSSSASSKTIAIDVPAAGTLADSATGPSMSTVACATFDAAPVVWLLTPETR